ncbi:MAG: hypothetical protein J6Q54_01290 [Oscillospiraceae bacterium]|nr:hypothetical protein [Oscillospiraceae bacterium]
MKTCLSLLLSVLLIAVLFAACGEEKPTEQPPKETTAVSAYRSGEGYTELTDPLSWEKINSFPIKSADMSIDELRQLCVDFFRYGKTAQWIPNDNYDFAHSSDGSNPDTLYGGMVYGGLPYIGLASSAIYRLLDYMDPETGVVNIKDAGEYQKMFGNQCAQGTYVGWSRVINSANYEGTPGMTRKRNFHLVGDYTYQNIEEMEKWSGNYGTDEVVRNEIEEYDLYEYYALLQHGDGIVYYTTAGHVVMIATDPVVVRDAEGKINPDESFVTVLDQTPTWRDGVNEFGQSYQYQANVDEKWTFKYMRQHNYLPITFAEWLGLDPIEETEVKFHHTGDTITMEQLTSTDITCNYHIYDAYASFCDSRGNEVLRLVNHSNYASNYDARFSTTQSINHDMFGSVASLRSGETYTVTIFVQLGTGERPTLWSGKLIAE